MSVHWRPRQGSCSEDIGVSGHWRPRQGSCKRGFSCRDIKEGQG